jgi:hypothetical protein
LIFLQSGLATYYLFSLLVVYLILGFIVARKRDVRPHDLYLSKAFAFPFFCVVITLLPLFVVGWDWVRWIMGIWHISFCMFMLELDKKFTESAGRIAILGVKILSPSVFITIFFPGVFTRISEC